ncbi:cobalt ECF transporter T component CbiQ [Vibrio albus]|uniref:Cobalt ECF transporter T component CbiQ n=1 Tax=Vibrio albus TaxID=2200953 RepID=A0A2U3B647_9VIBR|nr:cobalt ECF transporter T component CbiQ [Vibrio albus]PWI32242.1 cobalt ECF transporter T component CbiQ [Vibrio albus]
MLIIDKFAYQSRWAKVSPGYKWWFYVMALVSALILPPLLQWGLFLLLMFMACYGGRLSVRQYIQWLTIPAGFLFLSLLTAMIVYVTNRGELLAGLPFMGGYIGVTTETLNRSYVTLSRCACSIAATLCFVVTTPFNQCVQLLKSARLPSVLVEQVALTYRFIFIFIEEAHSLYCAQTLRFGYVNRRRSLKSLAMLSGVLLQRVLARHQQMQNALSVKLYQGEFHL